MRRDNELIRILMLELEKANQVVTGNLQVEGYSSDQVKYHLAQIIDSNFALGKAIYSVGNPDPTIPVVLNITRLTPDGHDFIDSIRNNTVWAKVKEKAASVGGNVPLHVIKELGVSFTKQLLGLE